MKTLELKTVSRLAAALILPASTHLYAAMLYVSLESPNPTPPFATWATAATNIQQAADAASPGDEIVVTNGVYRVGTVETNGLNRVALMKPVTLRSVNGQYVTVIEGATNGVRCAFVGDGSVLSGFTLTNGGSYLSGGGVFSETSGTVTNCTLAGNSAHAGGGAYGGTLLSCTLTGNSAEQGGGAVWSTLRHCVLTGNSAQSVGGGVYCCDLHDCVLSRNRAEHGGAVFGAGSPGELEVHVLDNCTIADNSAEISGGGVEGGKYALCRLYNCILSRNLAPVGPNYVGGVDIVYSCTSPLPTAGPGNIDADPRFMDAASGDFRLRPDSPCIDTGTNLTEFLTTDLLGLPRPLDGTSDGIARSDMGAHEFNPYRFEPGLQVTPSGFEFTVRGEPGKTVRIERNRDLATWELVATVPIPASGQTLIDPAATSEPFLFYRAAAR